MICTKCGLDKPREAFPYWRKKRTGERVPRTECKACRIGVPEDHKRCSMRGKCAHPAGAVLPLDEFDDDDARADKKCPRCHVCVEVHGPPGMYPPLSARERRTHGDVDPLAMEAWYPQKDNGLWARPDEMTPEQYALYVEMEAKRRTAGWYD